MLRDANAVSDLLRKKGCGILLRNGTRSKLEGVLCCDLAKVVSSNVTRKDKARMANGRVLLPDTFRCGV